MTGTINGTVIIVAKLLLLLFIRISFFGVRGGIFRVAGLRIRGTSLALLLIFVNIP